MSIKKFTKVTIAIIAAIVVLTLGVLVNLKRANDLRKYAVANNCDWSWSGSAYGDDRDWVCRKK